MFKTRAYDKRKYKVENRMMHSQTQGGIWLSNHPNRNDPKSTMDEVNFDKIVGNGRSKFR